MAAPPAFTCQAWIIGVATRPDLNNLPLSPGFSLQAMFICLLVGCQGDQVPVIPGKLLLSPLSVPSKVSTDPNCSKLKENACSSEQHQHETPGKEFTTKKH